MNTKLFSLSTASALLLAMTNVQAAPPVAELKVIGTLTVPTCTVGSADDGVYNIGKVSATMVKPTAVTPLTAMNKTWTITCDAETYLNFKPVDNRADTAIAGSATAFGRVSVNERALENGRASVNLSVLVNVRVSGDERVS